ncbi:DUF6506 family protein [Agromyces silvae]|uniref:DUF6506 family protein n=1 Tax=Agromyces silvae TaxID=3388266 RepID=UPI00280AF415|nr:DUF6506 family protein [Agromyces protaetiae]
MHAHRAVIFEAPGADPAKDRVVRPRAGGSTTIVAVSDAAEIPAIANELADRDIRLIELCGGVSPVWRGRAARAAGGRARVSSVTFGIESLGAAARYNAAFTEGAETTQAFILLEPGADPADRIVLTPDAVPIHLVPVPDATTAAAVAAGLAADGVLLIELYGGFGSEDIERVLEAVDGRSAVGVGSFAIDAIDAAA